MIYYKNKIQFSTNCQNISCSILSKHGIKLTKLAHFLKCLMSWALIEAKRKELAEDDNRFSSIFWTSVILSYFLENWSNAENFHMR